MIILKANKSLILFTHIYQSAHSCLYQISLTTGMKSDQDKIKDSVLSETVSDLHTNLLDVRDKENRFDGLDNMKILGYGVGHFINDLVAACWFNYLLFFLNRVVKTTAAPAAMLAGQIADGIATPIVGYLSDRTKTKFGQRTPWYVVGLVLVVACYIPIYQTFKSDNAASELAYYTIFPAVFNIGWAALQISHMSLVPSLTCSRKRRDKLNNLRNTFTFISNFGVLSLGVLIFKFMSNPPLEYALISYIVTVFGLAASFFFLYEVREVQLTDICREKSEKLKLMVEEQNKVRLPSSASNIEFSDDLEGVHISKRQSLKKAQSIADWFKMPKFYLFGICYMGVRLYTNMFGTFLPFYLIGVLKLGLEDEEQTDSSVPFTVALVPLIVYLFSVIASSRLNWFYGKFGRKAALSTGTIICVLSLGSMLLLTERTGWVMYIIAVFVGISQTLVLSTGINFISDVVGTKAKTGAFVFGIYSLLDKFSAGIVIFLISSTEAYSKKDLQTLTDSEKQFIRYTMVLVPSLASVLATLIVITYPIQEYNKKSKREEGEMKKRKSSIEEQLVM